LREDIAGGDVTSLACIPPDRILRARIATRQAACISGNQLAVETFRHCSPNLEVKIEQPDGSHAEPGETVITVAGNARAILAAERVALNYLQRLTGIATLTTAFVRAIEGTGVRILDTRKTTPGWRLLEKYAVCCGGGTNHRMNLNDRILIKDNHLAAIAESVGSQIIAAVKSARDLFPNHLVEVETDTLDQVQEAVRAGADIILLDNMSPADLRTAVQLINKAAISEASGGITLATVREVALTGVDFISIGSLTHSAPAVDLGLDYF